MIPYFLESVMSILAPWLALILVIAFVSYHRFSLAVFAAIGGSEIGRAHV